MRTPLASPRPLLSLALASAVAVTGLTTGGTTGAAPAAAPEFSESVLFRAGSGGYSCYRIPAVIRAGDGSLLAFAEGRVNSCADAGDIDIVLRRSTDNGATWDAQRIVLEGGGDTRGNPAPVLDRETGRISLLSTHNPGDDDTRRTPYLQHSTDNGVTWSPARNMGAQLSKPEWDRWYATGPGHGIQLERGPHAGRLLVGGNHQGLDGRQGAHLLYSDDGGLNWKLGADDTRGILDVKPQELSLFERTDGATYAAARDERGSDEGNRAFAVSGDAGESWDRPFRTVPKLVTPVVQGSTLRHGEQEVLFSAPAHPANRQAMSIRATRDEGESWESWQEGRIITWGPAAYSDLVQLGEDRVGLLYEGGSANPYETIRWARFNDAFLEQPNGDPPDLPDPPEPGPTTPDASGNGNDGYVRGSASLRPGRFGQSLFFDNADGPGETADARVEVPYDESLDIGHEDFTWTGWFKYGRTTGQHALVWAYRVGGSAPQVWLRAEPESNRVRARMQSEQAAVDVSTTRAYNDNAWHFVSLQRKYGDFTLSVDGESVSVPDTGGSPTIGKEFGIDGIHLGQRLDGQNRFHGYLDDMRMYDRALTGAELNRIRASGAAIDGNRQLWIPLDVVDPEE